MVESYFAKRNHKVSIITSEPSSKTPFYKLSPDIETIGLEELHRQEKLLSRKILLFITKSFSLSSVYPNNLDNGQNNVSKIFTSS